jgi:ribonuclease HI
MGLAWLQTAPSAPLISYSTAFTASFPSSSTAELAAIFTAILVTPAKCHIKIFTDSSTVISQFSKYQLLSTISPSKRPFLKIVNVHIWQCIFQIIYTLDLKVSMVKVKAHSGDFYNEKVDQLAKTSLDSSALHLNINNQSHTTLYYNNLAIASPIRQFIKNINQTESLSAFLNLDVNSKYINMAID